MKAHWALIIFAAGLGTGWLIFGGGMRESEEAAGHKSTAPVARKRDARPEKTPHESKFRNFTKEHPKRSDEDRQAFKKFLAPADRAAAIEALFAQAGPPRGIPSASKPMLAEILKTWASEDFDEAWAWCQRTESDNNRKFVAARLLEGLVDKDPDRALALHVEMVTEDPGFISTVPANIFKQAASKDAASFLEVLGIFGKLTIDPDPFAENGGEAVDFDVNFDFQQVADGITAREGGAPIGFPTNFLSTWAERDADAAYAWFSSSQGEGLLENFDKLLEGIENQGVPGASYAWAAEKLREPGTTLIRTLTFNAANTAINSIAQAMPDIASRDHFICDVMAMSPWDNPAGVYSDTLTLMSTPAVRLETLRELGKSNKLDAAEIPDAHLQQWGLTRQQVEQLQSPDRSGHPELSPPP
jgi:hypothetical protein